MKQLWSEGIFALATECLMFLCNFGTSPFLSCFCVHGQPVPPEHVKIVRCVVFDHCFCSRTVLENLNRLMFCIRFFLYEIFDEEVLFKLDTFCSLQHPMIFFGVSPFCRPGLSSGHLRCQRLRCSYCVTSTCPPESPTSDSDSHHDPTSSPKLLWSHPWKKNCPRSLFAIWPG